VAGRPPGTATWSRSLVNVAAHHASVLLELWLADAPVRQVCFLLFSSGGNPKHEALVEECWRARGGERRSTVPSKIKRKLCRLAVDHTVRLRRQMMLHKMNLADRERLRRAGYTNLQIDEIMARHPPRQPHVAQPDIDEVMKRLNRRAPPVTLRRKAHERILRR
jgi:hypothetical protein